MSKVTAFQREVKKATVARRSRDFPALKPSLTSTRVSQSFAHIPVAKAAMLYER
jgi:hypothetical protein